MFARNIIVLIAIWCNINVVKTQRPPRVPQLFSTGQPLTEDTYSKLSNLLQLMLNREMVQQISNKVNKTQSLRSRLLVPPPPPKVLSTYQLSPVPVQTKQIARPVKQPYFVPVTQNYYPNPPIMRSAYRNPSINPIAYTNRLYTNRIVNSVTPDILPRDTVMVLYKPNLVSYPQRYGRFLRQITMKVLQPYFVTRL